MFVTRYGHAAVLVEISGIRVLIDPGKFSADEVFGLSHLQAIVVTHQHADHVDEDRIGTLVAANPDAILLAAPDTVAFLGDAWTPNAANLITRIGSITITGVGEKHAVIFDELPRVDNVGVLIAADGEPTFFHPGDAYEYAPEDVDLLALPLSAPWTKAAETIDFARRVAPKVLFPIHDATISDLAYGIYWGHIENFSDVPDTQRLGPRDHLIYEIS